VVNISVTLRGKEYRVKEKEGILTLDLSRKNVSDIAEIYGLNQISNLNVLLLAENSITEIKNLEGLSNLLTLNLGGNQISEIKGLETLVNLQVLELWDNRITEIKGLENQKNLVRFYIGGNPATSWVEREFGMDIATMKKEHLDFGNGLVLNPLKIVTYCQKQEGTTKGQIEIDNPSLSTAQKMKMLEKLVKHATRVKIDDMAGVLDIPRSELLRKLLEIGDNIEFTIEEEVVVFGSGGATNFIATLEAEFKEWGRSTEKV
jgi:hypothetical protein